MKYDRTRGATALPVVMNVTVEVVVTVAIAAPPVVTVVPAVVEVTKEKCLRNKWTPTICYLLY
jgi:hypothetical protein